MNDLKRYCKTSDIDILKTLSPEIQKSLLEHAPKTIDKYRNDNNNIYVLRAKEIIDILTNLEQGDPAKCTKLNALKWTGNSCYIDSVLFALLAIPSYFTKKYIFQAELENSIENDLQIRQNIQRELIRIGRHIRGYEQMADNTCRDLRKSLKYYPHPEEFHGTGMADAGEFLTYILDMFDSNVAHTYLVNYATNNVADSRPPFEDLTKISSSYYTKSSIVRYVTTENLESLDVNKMHHIRNFLSIKDDSGELDENNLYKVGGRSFLRKISYNVLLDSPYIIFRLDRKKFIDYDEFEFLDVSILPSQTLTIHSNKRFVLCAIVIFEDYHYTCYFYNCGNWFYYDDISPIQKIKLIGSYDNMINSSPSPLKNGTLYFYNTL